MKENKSEAAMYDLLKRVEQHLNILAPHVKERTTAQLLEKCGEAIVEQWNDTVRLDWMLNATDDELNSLPSWTRQDIDNVIKSNNQKGNDND